MVMLGALGDLVWNDPVIKSKKIPQIDLSNTVDIHKAHFQDLHTFIPYLYIGHSSWYFSPDLTMSPGTIRLTQITFYLIIPQQGRINPLRGPSTIPRSYNFLFLFFLQLS